MNFYTVFFCTHIYVKKRTTLERKDDVFFVLLFCFDTQEQLTCTEPCLSAGVRLPSVAPGLGTSGHAATPPLAFV